MSAFGWFFGFARHVTKTKHGKRRDGDNTTLLVKDLLIFESTFFFQRIAWFWSSLVWDFHITHSATSKLENRLAHFESSGYLFCAFFRCAFCRDSCEISSWSAFFRSLPPSFLWFIESVVYLWSLSAWVDEWPIDFQSSFRRRKRRRWTNNLLRGNNATISFEKWDIIRVHTQHTAAMQPHKKKRCEKWAPADYGESHAHTAFASNQYIDANAFEFMLCIHLFLLEMDTVRFKDNKNLSASMRYFMIDFGRTVSEPERVACVPTAPRIAIIWLGPQFRVAGKL